MRLIGLFSLSLLASGCGGSIVHHRPTDPVADDAVTAMWAAEIRQTAQHGDWFLSRSYSFTGDIIALGTRGEDFSHAAMYDAERDVVIEAVPPAVREIALERFLHRNRHVVLMRPAGLTDEQRRNMVLRARSVVGHAFDTSSMLGLWNSDDEFYCTELLVWSIAGEENRVIAPAALLDYGEVVYFSGVREATPTVARAASRLGIALPPATATAATARWSMLAP
jgi:hypothetical protein